MIGIEKKLLQWVARQIFLQKFLANMKDFLSRSKPPPEDQNGASTIG